MERGYHEYTEKHYENGKYIISKIEKTSHYYPVTTLYGEATVVKTGPLGRFAFMRNGTTYFTEGNLHEALICTKDLVNPRVYYDYSQLTFDRDMRKEWNTLHSFNKSKEDWKPVDYKVEAQHL